MTCPPLTLWGHRGCRGRQSPPENSLAAFAEAIAQGADGIELDVFLTRDEQLVVFHDDRLERLSDGRGLISAQGLHELRALRLKSPAGTATDQGIPTLIEVLDLVAAWRQAACRDDRHRARAAAFVVNIETKGWGIAEFVVAEVAKRLASGWTHRNFLNSSFDMRTLRRMRQLMPQLALGALFAGPLQQPRAPWDVTVDELASCLAQVTDVQPETVNLTLPSLRQPGALDLIRSAGARPVAWTADEAPPESLTADEGRALVRFLADNDVVLITDATGAMRALEQAASRPVPEQDAGDERL